MKIYLIAFFLSYLFFFVNSLHLNTNQIKLISNLIQNPNLSQRERKIINLVLYNSYEKWAISQAKEFKMLHRYKCMNIKMDELLLVSKIGLYKSIQKYNGKYKFTNYSYIYVRSELLKLLTDTYSLSILPKKYRTKSKKNDYNKTVINNYNSYTQKLLHTKLFVNYEQWQLDEIFHNDENILNKINVKYDYLSKINKILYSEDLDLDPFMKRIIYIKFLLNRDNYMSNKNIAELMCCSEETIRKKINDYFSKTLNHTNT